MAEVRLVIFDCDGVLVDSEPLAMRVLVEAIAAQGIAIEPQAAFRDYLGRSLASISKSLNDSHGMPLGQAALDSMRHDLYALYRRELRPTRFIAETLDKLDLPFCVASSSGLERIRLSLELTGLIDRFEPHIFSASMVERGKPAPDLFLHAAERMGVAPAHCLVIEDSPAGIMAARAAGMRVFAYLGGGHIEPAALRGEIEGLGPDALMDDMRWLPGLIDLQQARQRGPVDLLAAVDVGTGSARAGVFLPSGRMLARAERPIRMRRSDADHAEHDSEQIWSAVGSAVRGAMRAAGAEAGEVAGISFDATCSLVVRDRELRPLGVSLTGEDRWDTIAWLDHRAAAEAAACTATGHAVLDNVGGVMSPEMEVPKLMWLKRHLPQRWAQMGAGFDLADFLTWKASGSNARSQCTLTCKWTYLSHAATGWQRDFLDQVGLDDLLERAALPRAATPIGSDLGALTPEAAAALGLTERCRVGAGLIDAHAGTLGALGVAATSDELDRHLVLVAGTSSCVMALSSDPRPVPAVWGPFLGAVLPGAWLNEAGQSATGALLDHVLRWHSAGGEPTAELHARVVRRIGALRQADPGFADRLHVLPDFHGNRSPLADPLARGVISGLTLDSDFDSLCRLYWRTAVSIALGVRHILETLMEAGYATDRLAIAGGHGKNPLLVELYADATGCTVVEPETPDATLLGVAAVAATAAGLHPDISRAAAAMAQGGRDRRPDPNRSYDRDYAIFREMLRQRQVIEAMGGT